jgi:ABC-type multidrug transport system fused ATPase/permease subunit
MISALDEQAQASVTRGVKAEFAGRNIWVLHRASLARYFDRPLVIGNSRLPEQGSPAELAERNDSLLTLLAAAE